MIVANTPLHRIFSKNFQDLMQRQGGRSRFFRLIQFHDLQQPVCRPDFILLADQARFDPMLNQRIYVSIHLQSSNSTPPSLRIPEYL